MEQARGLRNKLTHKMRSNLEQRDYHKSVRIMRNGQISQQLLTRKKVEFYIRPNTKGNLHMYLKYNMKKNSLKCKRGQYNFW